MAEFLEQCVSAVAEKLRDTKLLNDLIVSDFI